MSPSASPAVDSPSSAPRDAEVAAAVEVRDLSRRYGQRWALARLSFSLPAGRALLLTGHNGSGKTTLLKLLATALRPTAGSLRIFGRDAVEERDWLRTRTAFISHASFLYEELTAQENLLLAARLYGCPDPAAHVSAALEEVAMADRARHPVRQFSAGMRKRVAVARMLLKRPALALLDEPFGELDPQGIAQMEALIGQLKAAGTTVVLATHLVEQGEGLCEQRLHLKDGRACPP